MIIVLQAYKKTTDALMPNRIEDGVDKDVDSSKIWFSVSYQKYRMKQL
jgi:hypothetical protein